MTAPVPEARPNNAGKLVVVGMLLVAALAGGFAWWWNYNRGRRALEFYGPEAARLIRTAPTVEILVVGEPPDEGRKPTDGELEFGLPVQKRIDISSVPGLLNARASLLSDASYLQDESIRRDESNDGRFVRFADETDEVVLRFTEKGAVFVERPRGGGRRLTKKTADGWRTFLERNLQSGQANDARPSAPAGNGDQSEAENF